MFNQRVRLTVLPVSLCCGIVLAVAGCIPLQQNTRETPPVMVKQEVVVETFTSDRKPGDYSREIARLKKVIKSHPERSERVKAHLHLASLYASYKNPGKDYTLALEELNRYISLNPKAAKEYDVQNRLHILREIAQLSEKNVKLGQAIEELKLLDQQIEQKRERYR
jgi:hypothetical protein